MSTAGSAQQGGPARPPSPLGLFVLKPTVQSTPHLLGCAFVTYTDSKRQELQKDVCA